MESTPIQLMNLVLQDNQWFDIFRTRRDVKNMLRSIYNMRLHHGLIVAAMTQMANEVNNFSGTQQQLNVKLAQLSTTQSICAAASQLVTDTETMLRNDMMDQDLSNLASLHPIDYHGMEAAHPEKVETKPATEAKVEETARLEENPVLDAIDHIIDLDAHDDQQSKDAITCGKMDINQPTLVNFYTNWCGFSRKFMPLWNDLQEEACNEPINFLKVNCEEKKEFCRSFNVRQYPTIKLLTKGQVIDFPSEMKRTHYNLAEFIKKHTQIDLS